MTLIGDVALNVLTQGSSILEAVARLDQARRKLILVTDDDGRLVGTVSDGDVRRGLMRRIDMAGPITQVMNADPVALKEGQPEATARKRLAERGVSVAPVVDRDGRVLGLYPDVSAFAAERDNLVVIMAGGRGVRLAPLTQTCPKPMLKVAGRPVLETIIERMRAQGFRRFRLAVNYLAEMIEGHFGDGDGFGVEIDYLRETDPRGTAGALSLLAERPDEPFIVMNGDVLTRTVFGDLLDFHDEHRAAATVCVREHHFKAPHGVIETDGPLMVSVREKPTFRWLANAGIYCLSPEALDRVPATGAYDMPELLAALHAAAQPVAAFPIHEYWLDLGQHPDFELAQTEFPTVEA